jgi:hypothetical protein
MPNVRRLTIIAAVVLLTAIAVGAKDWRGLLPMHSTRADVLSQLGPAIGNPNPAVGDRWVYSLEDADVLFMFAGKGSLGTDVCEGAVAEGTLLAISVKPKHELSLVSLNLNESSLKRFNPADSNTDLIGLVDEQEGVVVRVATQFVEEVVYVPTLSDRARCPKFFNNLEDFVKVAAKNFCGMALDNYGNIRFSDEKGRLDNFAIQLQNFPDQTGYIIVFAGRKAVVAEAQLRADRARNYLINVRKIDPARVKTIDGGYLEDLTVYLRLVPAGAEAPVPDPTVDPKDVEIVYPKKHRPRSNNN